MGWCLVDWEDHAGLGLECGGDGVVLWVVVGVLVVERIGVVVD